MRCMCRRLAGRPTNDQRDGANPSPPTSRRCKVPSFCIGRSLAPWIIRTRHGPQPEEKAACALRVEPLASDSSTRGWCGPEPTHQQALWVPLCGPVVRDAPVSCAVDHSIRPRPGMQLGEKAALRAEALASTTGKPGTVVTIRGGPSGRFPSLMDAEASAEPSEEGLLGTLRAFRLDGGLVSTTVCMRRLAFEKGWSVSKERVQLRRVIDTIARRDKRPRKKR